MEEELVAVSPAKTEVVATRRNLQVDDVVVVMDDNSPRNCWKVARVKGTFPDGDGLVRKVRIKIADRNLDRTDDLLDRC